MRRFRHSERGLSEIVGTLMLVVIVVGAATLLAAFVASYQKQVQTEETLSHDQSLESIKILGLTTAVSGGVFTQFSFTLASEYVNPSGILDVYINGNPLLDFAWYNVSTNTAGTYNAVSSTNDLILLPFQQVTVETCLVATCSTSGGPIASSFLPGEAPSPNSYIKFDVFTHLHNDFTQVYLPPTPLAVVSEINPSGNNPITLLDGSTSFQPGGNLSIVNWNWNISGGALGTAAFVSTSDSVTSQATTGTGPTYTITGTGTATFSVPSNFVYWMGDPVFPANPITSDFTNTGGCAAPTVASFTATGGSGAGGSVTVLFTFSVTFNSCTSEPTMDFSAAGNGVTLAPYLVESGEEYEVSPALAVPIDGQTPYSVTLAVTNSDGLAGVVTLSYTPIS